MCIMKKKMKLFCLICLLVLSFATVCVCEGETGLFTMLREDGSGFIVAKQNGQITELSATYCSDKCGGLYIKASFKDAKLGQIYYLSRERELTLLQENDAYYGNESSQYVWRIFLYNNQLAGIDPYSKTVKMFDGNEWKVVTQLDLSQFPTAQKAKNFLINDVAANNIGNKLYISALAYSESVIEIDLETGTVKPLNETKNIKAHLMENHESLMYSDKDSRVFQLDTKTCETTICFDALFSNVCDYWDGIYYGIDDKELLAWRGDQTEGIVFSTRLPVDEDGIMSVQVTAIDSDTVLINNNTMLELLSLKEEYVKKQIYAITVDDDHPQIEDYLVDMLENPSRGYAMMDADITPHFDEPTLIYSTDMPEELPFYADLDLYSAVDMPFKTLTLRQFEKNLRLVCKSIGLSSKWKWKVSGYDYNEGIYTYKAEINGITVTVEMLEKNKDEPIGNVHVTRKLKKSKDGDQFGKVFVCCYIGMYGQPNAEDWEKIKPAFDGEWCVDEEKFMLLKEYKETNDYLTLGKNDCFDYEAGIANLTCWADLGDIF